MKNSRIISSIIIVLAFVFPALLSGQQIITTSGGNGSGAGGKVSYTVGQVVNNIYTTASGSVIEGVQQPYEISEETGVEENEEMNLTITVFPNPTEDYLMISIKDIDVQNLSYKLFRVDGKKITNGKINGNETKIKMNDLSPAVYVLKISNKNKDVKVFKIIKN